MDYSYLNAWARRNPEKVKNYRRKTSKRQLEILTSTWGTSGDLQRNVTNGNRGEKVAKGILKLEGFTDIVWLSERQHGFAFDYIARKDCVVWFIEVTTSWRKSIPMCQVLTQLINWFGARYAVLFINLRRKQYFVKETRDLNKVPRSRALAQQDMKAMKTF